MPTEEIPTDFASAERVSRAVIDAQASLFTHDSLVCNLAEGMPSGFVILNSQRQIVYANAEFGRAAGVDDHRTLLGQRPGEALACVHASESDGGCGTTEFCSTCGAVRAILYAQHRHQRSIQECRIIRVDAEGREEALDLRVWATPISANGEAFTLFAALDISDEKRRHALERIFFHDIGNTAGVIRGIADLMNMTAGMAPSDDLNFSEMLNEASQRLVEEINTQRHLLAAERDELVVRPAALESLAFLQGLADMYRKHYVAEGRHIRIRPDAQAVGFHSDRALLGRVLGNMLKNALEASRPGETVHLGCTATDGGVEFSVHNPTYMPRHVQLQVFQRSFSTKGENRGLGTYSMKLLSERYLKGSVRFSSDQRDGTSFFARFPLHL